MRLKSFSTQLPYYFPAFCFIFVLFVLAKEVYGILVPPNPSPRAMEVRSPNHWSIREFLVWGFNEASIFE